MEHTVAPESDLRSYVRAFRRRKWLFFSVFFLVAVAIGAGSWVRSSPIEAPISYLSNTEILVTPPAPSEEPKEPESLNTWFASKELFSQLIMSEEVLERVRQSAKSPKGLEELRASITVAPSENSENLVNMWESFLVKVNVEGDSPEESQQIAQALVDEVIEYTQELAARDVIASRKALEKMALSSKKAAEESQRKLIEWRKQNDVWDIEQLVEAQGARIAELENRREEELQKVREESKKLAQIRSHVHPQSDSLPWEVVNLKSSELGKLAETRTLKRSELEQLRKVYTDSNAIVQQKMLEVEEADSAYEGERQALVGSLLGEQQARLAEVEAKVRSIEENLARLKNDKSLADSQVELQQLQGELENHRLNLQNLLDQINETRVLEQRRRHLAAFTVVQKPLPGVSVEFPQHRKVETTHLLTAFMFALALAAATVYGAETFSVGMRLKPQVEKVLGLPILGCLPKMPAQATSSGFSVVHEAPDSFASERFRSIVVNLMRQEKKINKVLVTSCWPSEGKTFVSLNLAVALARFDLRVTLLDGDLRRPRLTEDFGRLGQAGFRQYLGEEQLPLEELSVSTDLSKLCFLPAGTGSENSTELLSGRRSLEALAGTDESRFLVIDSSPLSVCSDSILMSEEVDGVVLVIGADQWDGDAELEQVLRLEDQGVKILGVVLNGVKEQELLYGSKDSLARYYQSPAKPTKSKFSFWK